MAVRPALLLTTLVLIAGIGAAAEPLVVPLWPERDATADIAGEHWTERSKTDHRDRSVSNVRWPTLSLTLPAAESATGAAVVICPGGGYGSLAIDKEGFDVAGWLAGHGIAGIVLKYRLPRPEQSMGEDPWPVQDVQRAVRLVRSRAGEWRIDPARIGVMGFSAGGHLAATASTHVAAADPAAADPLLKLSSRPDFTILAYPVVTLSGPATHSGSRDNPARQGRRRQAAGGILARTPDQCPVAAGLPGPRRRRRGQDRQQRALRRGAQDRRRALRVPAPDHRGPRLRPRHPRRRAGGLAGGVPGLDESARAARPQIALATGPLSNRLEIAPRFRISLAVSTSKTEGSPWFHRLHQPNACRPQRPRQRAAGAATFPRRADLTAAGAAERKLTLDRDQPRRRARRRPHPAPTAGRRARHRPRRALHAPWRSASSSPPTM